MSEKRKKHIDSLENLLTDYKQAYSRHKQWHKQVLRVVATSKDPQDKVFDIMNIVRTMELEDATETGKRLA